MYEGKSSSKLVQPSDVVGQLPGWKSEWERKNKCSDFCAGTFVDLL